MTLLTTRPAGGGGIPIPWRHHGSHSVEKSPPSSPLDACSGDFSQGAGGLFQDSSGWYGRAVLDTSLVNTGYNLRIILFWATG